MSACVCAWVLVCVSNFVWFLTPTMRRRRPKLAVASRKNRARWGSLAFFFLHFVDRASCNDSWWMTNVMHKFSSICLFPFTTLYVFRSHSAHHQEGKIISIKPLITVLLCWWPRCVQVRPAHISATNILVEWLLPEAVLIQFVSPDDEHCVLETCREFIQ